MLNSKQVPISPSEISTIKSEINKCHQEKKEFGKQLGRIMSNSGSFAANTPGYTETEDLIKIVEGKIEQYNQILKQTTPIKDVAELPQEYITIYSKVVTKDQAGKTMKYYICHLPEKSNLKGVASLTPRSPVGIALIGKKNKDVIQIELPKGKVELTIIKHENII